MNKSYIGVTGFMSRDEVEQVLSVFPENSNMEKKREPKFSDMSFRFPGQIPVGKFEFSCACGRLSGPKEISGDKSSLKCEECGLEFKFKQQTTHFHLFITS